MRLKAMLLATVMVGSAAHAGADKPILAPAPDWVKPVALPAVPEKGDEAPLRVMLADQQARLEAGKVSNYVDVALQLQTPQGLAAGNLSFPWNPETDELTVHKLIIHRDGKIIDVLAAGQTFSVVRREPNLENATLDGVLTANIQPEGLQVGDILEYALTVSSSDPVLKGHVEQTGAGWNGLPFARTHFRAHWPSSLPVTLRQVGALPPLKTVKSGATTSVELSLENVEPVIAPRLAPARFAVGRMAEFSDFRSWAEAGALLAPLYDVAAKVPAEGALRTELEKIKAAGADPVKRAEAALALVQDRVRYVALLMGAGGLTPAKAEETWARRYGDCKAKTALLLALLHELGIEAEPVVVNAFSGDGLDQRLPMVGLFNHVLVRAHIGGRAYWLDGTRTGDTSLARLRTPDFGWGLPLVAKNAALVRMQPVPLDQPDYDLLIEIDARGGLAVPAPVKAQVLLRGDDAISTKLKVASVSGEARNNMLREYWKERLDDLEVTKLTATYNPETGTETLAMEGETRMDWAHDQYWTDSTDVGFEADFSRLAGPNSDAPIAMSFPAFSRTIEKIQLPPGFTEQNIYRKEPINETVAGIEYRRQSKLADNVFTIEQTQRSLLAELPIKDAPDAQKRLKELSDLPVAIRKPANYRLTTAETQQLLKEEPKTVAAFLVRGYRLMQADRYADAIVDFGDALAIEPRNALALANRGLSYIRLDQLESAKSDLDAAAAANPKLSVIYSGRGLLAQKQNQYQAAVDAYSRALEIGGADPFSLGYRAEANFALGNHDAALADAGQALELGPNWGNLYAIRAHILRSKGREDEALAEVKAMAERDRGLANQLFAGQLYRDFKRHDLAVKLFDDLIATNPDANLYLYRSEFRPKLAFAEREADFDAALKLKQDLSGALAGKARLQVERGNFPQAIELYSEMLRRQPGDMGPLLGRGIAYARAGEAGKAAQDFAAARGKTSEPATLNNLCWMKATENVALQIALSECDAALAKGPYKAALDSRAFVLLRMGRLDDAIAAYDKALAADGRYATSLFGRAVAWSLRGDHAKASADRAAALNLEPFVEDRFAEYGVTFQR